jgi:hypothetical protein
MENKRFFFLYKQWKRKVNGCDVDGMQKLIANGQIFQPHQN